MKESFRRSLTRAVVAGVASFSVLGSLASAEADGNETVRVQAKHIDSLRRMVVELHERQRLLEGRVEKLEGLRSEIAKMNEQLTALRSDVGSLHTEISDIGDDYRDYRAEYRNWARLQAVGEEIPSLVVLSGKKYENVQIRRVTESGLEIRHTGGSTRLLHSQLPGDLRDRFQWDGEEAALALAKENQDEALRARLHALTMRQKQQQRAEAARTAATDKRIRDLESRLAATQASIRGSRLQSSGALGERRPVGRSTSRYIYGSRARTSVYYYPVGRSYFPTPRVTRPRSSGVPVGSRFTRTVTRPPLRPTTTPRICPGGRD